jgi:hypothetical protein
MEMYLVFSTFIYDQIKQHVTGQSQVSTCKKRLKSWTALPPGSQIRIPNSTRLSAFPCICVVLCSRSLCHALETYKYQILINSVLQNQLKSRDSSVGIATRLLGDYMGCRFRFLAGAGNFSLHHRVQNGSGAYPAFCPMSNRGSFPGGKAAGAWSWPLTSI